MNFQAFSLLLVSPFPTCSRVLCHVLLIACMRACVRVFVCVQPLYSVLCGAAVWRSAATRPHHALQVQQECLDREA